MPRFAANLSMMFTEWTFLDRFGAAADAGFEAVEYAARGLGEGRTGNGSYPGSRN